MRTPALRILSGLWFKMGDGSLDGSRRSLSPDFPRSNPIRSSFRDGTDPALRGTQGAP